ncbi:MAG: non-hydrolyzing UDP-N-acetylglucosamine 2-epimerase [Solirubrobacteraceae bacterium]
MKILTVVGNRPQFIKAAVVSRPLRAAHEELLVHTGQHHDASLSEVFFSELDLPRADVELSISGGSNTSQTARMLAALEPILLERRPQATLVYGDTNSTLAGALASAQSGVPVIHVEAGMRSFDRSMPEERNRVLADHLSDLLLCSSQTAVANLEAESARGEARLVGDVMVDLALARARDDSSSADVLCRYRVEHGGYLLVSAHRAGNVDRRDRLEALVGLLSALPLPTIFPVHPRTAGRLRESGLDAVLADARHVIQTEPLSYDEFAALLRSAAAVLTDSGGVQKEAYIAGVRCVTLRPSTEWVETVQAGWNTLVDLNREAALSALASEPPAERTALYGEGDAAACTVAAITAWGQRRLAG